MSVGNVALDADTLRALLQLLYGAGLRFGEAQRLTLDDVDLPDALLTLRNTKFYKTRLVPVCQELADALKLCRPVENAPSPRARPRPSSTTATGRSLVQRTAAHAFTKLLKEAGIGGSNDGRRAPCFHSLRHAAAVHRLESWYRQGAACPATAAPDASTWLGHTDLNGTRIYLSMTPELLHQASVRFDADVNGGGTMSDPRTLGPWLRRFLAEYIVTERNLARNTTEELPRYLRTPAAVRRGQGPAGQSNGSRCRITARHVRQFSTIRG